MKNYNKYIESPYLMYSDMNNLQGWRMSQKLPVNGFKSRKMYLSFMKTLKKVMMKMVIKDVLLK